MKVDWEEQWALFAPNFREGFAHVELGKEAPLKLKAGPGFGDLSHPTTRLCLDSLKRNIRQDDTVLDIGCGSGILSLAAAQLGAKSVFGLDIDPEAIQHARENQKANQLKAQFGHKLPLTFRPTLILMNMIQSEQKVAWSYDFPSARVITSGILSSQRSDYLSLTTLWGWTLLEESEEDSWLSFLFE